MRRCSATHCWREVHNAGIDSGARGTERSREAGCACADYQEFTLLAFSY
jgi:hypothetical protein